MTGDLAHKKIFPALYAMVKKGELERAGHRRRVVRSGRSTTCATGPATASTSSAAASTTRTRSSSSPGSCATSTATTATRRRSPSSKTRSGDCTRPAHYLAIPPSMFATVIEGLGTSGCGEERPGHRREAVRARPRLGPGAQPGAALGVPRAEHLPHRPLPRQGGDPEHPLLPVRQLVPRADLEPQLRAPGADHDGRGLRRAGPRQVLRGGRRAARRHREPPVPDGRRCSRWSRRSVPASRSCATPRSSVFERDADAQARRPRARPVRGLPRRGRAWRPTPTSRRSRRSASTSTRGGGRACRSTSGPARTCPVTCTEVRVELHRPPQRCSPSTSSCRTTPTTSASSSTRGSRSRLGARVKAAGDGFMGDSVELYLVQRPPRRDDRVRAAARRRDGRREPAVRARGRRRGVVAGRRQRAHRPRPGDPVQPCTPGVRPSRTGSSPIPTAGTTRSSIRVAC